jgi:hypothetical protein
VISTGEAGPFNWVLAGIGGAVFVWGLWLVWQAYQARSQRPHGS